MDWLSTVARASRLGVRPDFLRVDFMTYLSVRSLVALMRNKLRLVTHHLHVAVCRRQERRFFGCAGVAYFAGLCRNLQGEALDFLCFQISLFPARHPPEQHRVPSLLGKANMMRHVGSDPPAYSGSTTTILFHCPERRPETDESDHIG
jgi:hypothetical protein